MSVFILNLNLFVFQEDNSHFLISYCFIWDYPEADLETSSSISSLLVQVVSLGDESSKQ